ncbi:MAG TPA: NAD(P)-dependent oxidoreductase [Marmoricola sp.]|nr:NAD(P)-dependent oxidoreductase [Marmoricola sp.]
MQDGPVRVVVSGGTGAIGRAAVRALQAAGHDVVAVSPSAEDDQVLTGLGAEPSRADLFDVASLERVYVGADAVVNLASRVPVGYAAAWPGCWRRHDALRTTAVGNVVAAARAAGVRRVIQESDSFLYADHGDRWITEADSIEITPATEPSAVGESHALGFASPSHVGVVLRFGSVVGDDDITRFWLRAAANGRPVGVGRPDQWSHLVHTDDLGPAVVAALHAPTGVYNVGASPVLRGELVEGYAKAAGAESSGFLGPVLRRLAGPRVEPLTRSLRVSSDHFSAQTGWQPLRPAFDAAWFEAALTPAVAAS